MISDARIEHGAHGHGRLPPEHVRRVLVTGGAGYIGSQLVRMLLKRGYHVRVFDRLDYGSHGLESLLADPRCELLVGDACRPADVDHAVRDVQGVLALAAIVGDQACELDPDETVALNFAATRTLAAACEVHGVRRLVFASTCSVYGTDGETLPLTEDAPTRPVSLYARTRLRSEQLLLKHRGHLDVVILRLGTVFGLSPRMRFDLVVNGLAARAVVDGRIELVGGSQFRPLVHCVDAAQAFVLALEAPSDVAAGQIFNVGGDTLNYRIDEIGGFVREVVPSVAVARVTDTPDPRTYQVSSRKIRMSLGFRLERSVTDGVREIVGALQTDPALRRHDDAVYHNERALRSRVRPGGS